MISLLINVFFHPISLVQRTYIHMELTAKRHQIRQEIVFPIDGDRLIIDDAAPDGKSRERPVHIIQDKPVPVAAELPFRREERKPPAIGLVPGGFQKKPVSRVIHHQVFLHDGALHRMAVLQSNGASWMDRPHKDPSCLRLSEKVRPRQKPSCRCRRGKHRNQKHPVFLK